MYKGRCITLLLLTILMILFVLIEIGVYLTTDDFEDFVLTSLFVIFDVILFAVAILSIWSECQL